MQCEILPLIVSFLSGGAAGAVINHFFGRWRDCDSRKREFRGYIERVISEIQRTKHTDHGALWTYYVSNCPAMKKEQTIVAGDFQPTADFERLCVAASDMRHEHVFGVGREPRDVMIEPFYRLRDFIKTK